jgi:hypothetical protein
MRNFLGLAALTTSLYLSAASCQLQSAIAPKPREYQTTRFENASSGDSEEKEVQDLDSIIEATYRLKGEVTLKETLMTKDGTVIGERYNHMVAYCSTFNFAREDKKSYFGSAAHCMFNFTPQRNEYFDGLVIGNVTLESYDIYVTRYLRKEKKDEDNGLTSGPDFEEIKLAKLALLDKDNDLDASILVAEDLSERQFKPHNLLVHRNKLKIGLDLYSLGFPHKIIKTPFFTLNYSDGKNITKGIIRSVGEDSSSPSLLPGHIGTQAPLDKGMSGGPSVVIFNGEAYIAGLNTRIYTDSNEKYGISTGLTDLVERNKLTHLVKILKRIN